MPRQMGEIRVPVEPKLRYSMAGTWLDVTGGGGEVGAMLGTVLIAHWTRRPALRTNAGRETHSQPRQKESQKESLSAMRASI